jgi:hypothetical protein
VYVPEEMQNLTEDVQHTIINAVDEAINDLQVCVNEEELKSAWSKIAKDVKIDLRVIAAKDEMKNKLTSKTA